MNTKDIKTLQLLQILSDILDYKFEDVEEEQIQQWRIMIANLQKEIKQ